MINGNETELDPIQAAKQRLAQACMQQPMTPQGASISAYVNTTLLSAHVQALIEYTAPLEIDADGNPQLKGTFDDLLLKCLIAKAEVFERTAKEAPLIIAQRSHALDS